jgi:hypothetical protein
MVLKSRPLEKVYDHLCLLVIRCVYELPDTLSAGHVAMNHKDSTGTDAYQKQTS